MQLLKEHPLPEYKRPVYPNYHVSDGLGIDNRSGGTPASSK